MSVKPKVVLSPDFHYLMPKGIFSVMAQDFHEDTYETLIKEWENNCLNYEHMLQEVPGTAKQTRLLKIFQVDTFPPVTESNTVYTITSTHLRW